MVYCFKCEKEMRCLKTGFVFSDDYETYVTDLYVCESCMGLSTNKCYMTSDLSKLHMQSGFGFSDAFLDHVSTWYPHLYQRFIDKYNNGVSHVSRNI